MRSPNHPRQEKIDLLFDAISNNNINEVKRFIRKNANLNSQIANTKVTPLHLAVQKGNLDIVKILLEAKADPNLASIDGATPLHLAALSGNLGVVEALLKADAKPNLAMNDGYTPLHLALQKGNLGVVKVLLKAKANPNLVMNDNITPLHLAIQIGNLDIVKALLEAKANPDLAMNDDITPLRLAVQIGNLDIVEALLEAKADPSLARNDGSTPLHLAAQNDNLDIVKAFLEAKVNPDLLLNDCATPLQLAVQKGNLGVVEALLEDNANPNLARIDGATSLHLAVQNGNLDIVKALLEANANPDLVTNGGFTPLHLAVENGNLDIVKVLLEANANPDLATNDNITPLQLASFKGNLEIVKAIIEKKDQDCNLPNLMFLALLNNKFDFLEEFYKQIYIDDSSLILFSFQISILKENLIDEDKINKSLEILFNFLSEDKKIELLTMQKNGKTILEHAVENNHYSVASLIYSKSIDLIYKDDAEGQEMKSKILIKALKNYNNETEFFEFIKLVNGEGKLLPEREIEIQRLKLQESPEDQIKIDNALAEIKKTQEKHLTDVWKLYRAGDLEGFASLIKEDPTKILSFKYIEDKQDQDHPQKTFLHRLAEDNTDKGRRFLEQTFALMAGLKIARKEVPNLDLPCDIQYRDLKTKINKGEVHGVTPLYMAIFKRNEYTVQKLIRYSNLNTPITKENSSTGAIKEYSLFELALEKATFNSSNPALDSSNPALDSSDSKNSFKILEMITEGDKKARFPESAEQRARIASNYEKYKPEIKILLAERYPEEIKEIKEIKKLAKKYKDAESSSTEESGAGSGIQLRSENGVSFQSSRSDLRSRFEGLVLGQGR